MQDGATYELPPEAKASLAAIRAELNAESEVPSSTSSVSKSTSSFSSSSSSATSEDVNIHGENDVCVLTVYYFGTPSEPGSCPSPAFSPTDTATTTSAGDDKEAIRSTAASEDCSGHRCPNSSTNASSGDDRNNNSRSTGHEHEDYDNDGSNNRGAEPNQTPSTTPPPTPTAGDEKPAVRSPKRVLTVGDKLSAEPLFSSTDMSALWTSANGSIMFARQNAKSLDESGHEIFGGFQSSVLVASNVGRFERVLRSRETLRTEMQEGGSPARTIKKRGVWGWVPFRSQHEKDVERARGRVGEVETTLSDRACVVSHMSRGFGVEALYDRAAVELLHTCPTDHDLDPLDCRSDIPRSRSYRLLL